MSPKKLLSASLIPVEPEPTPKRTKLNAKTSARKTKTHLACRRRRAKKSWSSQLSCCFGFFGLDLGARRYGSIRCRAALAVLRTSCHAVSPWR